jgi:glycosyltransferase involved in cell wall biosynthesis
MKGRTRREEAMYEDKVISVLIPAYNEERLIGKVLDMIPEFVDHIIVVDDGSTDRTAQIARGKGTFVVSHRMNRGVGTAFKTGVTKALEMKTDILVNIDADGQFNPRDIAKLVAPIAKGQCDFVTGSRFKDKSIRPRMPLAKYLGNLGMSRLVSFLVNQRFYDVSCGFRAYSREALLRLNLFGAFTYTQETFLDLAFKGLALEEVPISVKGVREEGESRVANNLIRYGYQTAKIIFKAFRDYKPLRFFGFIGGAMVMIGLLSELFLLWHYFQTGRFSPYKVIGFGGAFAIGIGILVFITGFLADMLYRIRMNQEEILYHRRRELCIPKD